MISVINLLLVMAIIFGVALILASISDIRLSDKNKKKYAKTKQIQIVNAFAEILKNKHTEPDIFTARKFIMLSTKELDELVSEIERDINENY